MLKFLGRDRIAGIGTFCLLGSLMLGAGPQARAQDTPADDALDRLLEKVDPKTKDTPAQPRPTNTPKPGDAVKPGDQAKGSVTPGTENPKDKAQGQKPGDSGKVEDEELDSLLEKLGESKDEPKAKKEKPKGGGAGEPGETPPAPGGGEGQPGATKPESGDGLSPDKKQIDEHLEELSGVRRKRSQDKKQDPSSGPLGQTVKKMREVEQRLGKEDTGDETRGKQKEIVKDFDQLIAQAKQAGSSGSSGKPQRSTQQAGNKPGGPGDKPGSTGSGVGPAMPKKPDAKSALADSKDEWGHLPPELRGEMENVFKEEALPSRKTLIDRYYISVTRKSTGNRGE